MRGWILVSWNDRTKVLSADRLAVLMKEISVKRRSNKAKHARRIVMVSLHHNTHSEGFSSVTDECQLPPNWKELAGPLNTNGSVCLNFTCM
jgi:hypothetical protein